MSRRLVLITGGAGFLGEHLARTFLANDTRVRIFDSAPPPGWTQDIDIEYVSGDVRDAKLIQDAARHADAIVHAAFASPRQPLDTIRSVNVDGTAAVLAAARHHRARVVLISSTIVTAPQRVHPLWSAAPLSRLDRYRTTRIEAEQLAAHVSHTDVPVAAVRPQSFLGPGRLGAFGIIFELVRTGQPVPVLGDGGHRYQLLGVQDLAEGIRLLTASDATGVFSFGASRFSSVREDLREFITRVDSSSSLRHVSPAVGRIGLRSIELAGLVPLSEWHRHSAWRRDSVADCSRAQEELGWRAQQSNVDALTEAYTWYATTVRSAGTVQRTHPLPRAHAALGYLLRLLPRS